MKRGPTQIRLEGWYSFSQEMKKQGIDVVDFELSVENQPLPAEAAMALKVSQGTRLLREACSRVVRRAGGRVYFLAASLAGAYRQ